MINFLMVFIKPFLTLGDTKPYLGKCKILIEICGGNVDWQIFVLSEKKNTLSRSEVYTTRFLV